VIYGYVVNSETRIITTKLKEITKHNNTTIVNNYGERAIVGTGIIVITDIDIEEGAILPESVPDKSAEVPILTE
jgi:hypothetical protein